ncbi:MULTISPECIES: CHRD domain-containing protein [unclassified Arthrobacter]|uniref:CHRD domain-containing protein n=1 Tax=unclassified Arthrobacter TaxID=235627 RepID=UPI00047EB5C6|nr:MULTISPECIES: CHRD domain-containing protein [unclassified Arthrobacter]
MNKAMRFLAVPTLALGALAMASSPAMAAEESYSSTLGQLNGTTGTGSITLDVHGDTATVDLQVSGLAETFMDAPYPHVQHIHTGEEARGECPTPEEDENGDGIINTTDGDPAYGPIATTLTTSGATGPEESLNLELAGLGGNYQIQRDIDLNAETKAGLEAGKAVVVVHGLDPATAGVSEEVFNSPSDIAPELPLGATSPALCGVLVASQMGDMPAGGADTGVAQETGSNTGILALGGGLVLAAAAGGTFLVRRSNAKA